MGEKKVYVVWTRKGGMCWSVYDNRALAAEMVAEILSSEKAGQPGTQLLGIMEGIVLETTDLISNG